MALTLDATGNAVPTVGDPLTLAEVVGPKVAVAALNLMNHDGSQFKLEWHVTMAGGLTVVWADTFTVDDAIQAGYLSVPVPCFDQSFCILTLVSGASATVFWDIYAL
jgi:hypothetical protein